MRLPLRPVKFLGPRYFPHGAVSRDHRQGAVGCLSEQHSATIENASLAGQLGMRGRTGFSRETGSKPHHTAVRAGDGNMAAGEVAMLLTTSVGSLRRTRWLLRWRSHNQTRPLLLPAATKRPVGSAVTHWISSSPPSSRASSFAVGCQTVTAGVPERCSAEPMTMRWFSGVPPHAAIG